MPGARPALGAEPDRPSGEPYAADAGDDAIDRIEASWHRERPDVDVSSVGIVSRIWRIARHLEQARKERLAEHGTDRVTLETSSPCCAGRAPRSG